ncbi:MAG: hypothetical protein ACXVFQ_04345 [Solirubrobacteraceae bacterium]
MARDRDGACEFAVASPAALEAINRLSAAHGPLKFVQSLRP